MAETEPDFAELGVAGPIVASLAAAGITHPFPIQALTLPVALSGADIIGQAKTGTGKTLGFGIPLLQRVVGKTEDSSVTSDPESTPDSVADAKEQRLPQALVVVPTRELAKQVAADLVTASVQRDIDIMTIYGGMDFDPQINRLKSGVDVVDRDHRSARGSRERQAQQGLVDGGQPPEGFTGVDAYAQQLGDLADLIGVGRAPGQDAFGHQFGHGVVRVQSDGPPGAGDRDPVSQVAGAAVAVDGHGSGVVTESAGQ